MQKNKVKPLGRIPVIDFDKCVRCGKCLEACPLQAILEPLNTSCAKCVKYCMVMDVPCSPEILVFDYGLCDGCGACLPACPEGAVRWFSPGEAAPGRPRD